MTRVTLRYHWIWIVIITVCLCSVHHTAYAQTVEEMYQEQNDMEQKDLLIDEEGVQNEEEGSIETDGLSQSDSPLALFAKFIFYLVIVLALIYMLIRFLGMRQRKMQNHSIFQNLGGLSLGQNKSLQLVKMGQEVYVLGVADQITLIKEIREPEAKAWIENRLAEQEDNELANRLFRSLPWGKKADGEDNQAQDISFQQLFQSSIKQQKENQHSTLQQLVSKNSEQREGRFK